MLLIVKDRMCFCELLMILKIGRIFQKTLIDIKPRVLSIISVELIVGLFKAF